jgi:type IV secretion system protein VirB2
MPSLQTSTTPNDTEVSQRQAPSRRVRPYPFFLLLSLPAIALAQSSPFQTGATALQTNLLTIMTPVAVILVIGLGVMAMANRIAWGWVIGAIAGIALAFGAPQVVTWIRGMFGV